MQRIFLLKDGEPEEEALFKRPVRIPADASHDDLHPDPMAKLKTGSPTSAADRRPLEETGANAAAAVHSALPS